MDILNHRLVDCEAVHLTCSKNTRPLAPPDTIVLHYTAGGKEVQPSDVFVDEANGQPTYWHRYTDEQLKTVVLVCLLLMDRYPIRYLLRHSDITPRKIDPGPAFPPELLELNR